MRRFLLAAVATASTVGFVYADDEKAKPKAATPPATAAKDDKKAAEKKDDEKKDLTRKERLAEIQKELGKKRSEMVKEINALKPGKERDEAIQLYTKASVPFALKAFELAKEDVKDEATYPATMFAFQNGGKKVSQDAGDFLVDHFIEDARLKTAIPAIATNEVGPRVLGRLAEKTKDKDVRGAALFAISDTEVDNTDYPSTGKPLPADEAAAKLTATAAKLERLGTEYADVKITSRMGKTIGEAVAKKLYFVNNLTVGKKAPEFECEVLDTEAKKKLSEFKGNVVVLDVWATWCGPCRAMIPHERELVEKMKSKPFKLVSLSADDKKETLTKFLEKEEMPWTHLWNGSAKGNFLEQYQIRFYPTIYVLDAKGTIRFKHCRGEAMDHAVETLLKEMSGAE